MSYDKNITSLDNIEKKVRIDRELDMIIALDSKNIFIGNTF
jgi:hypothetical protein